MEVLSRHNGTWIVMMHVLGKVRFMSVSVRPVVKYDLVKMQ